MMMNNGAIKNVSILYAPCNIKFDFTLPQIKHGLNRDDGKAALGCAMWANYTSISFSDPNKVRLTIFGYWQYLMLNPNFDFSGWCQPYIFYVIRKYPLFDIIPTVFVCKMIDGLIEASCDHESSQLSFGNGFCGRCGFSGYFKLFLDFTGLPIRDLFGESELIVPSLPEIVGTFLESQGEHRNGDGSEGRQRRGNVIQKFPDVPRDDIRNVVGGAFFLAGIFIGMAYLVIRLWVGHK